MGKNVKCYHCGKTGEVEQYTFTDKNGRKVTKVKAGEPFKRLEEGKWICRDCKKFSCKKCGILLSNTYKCKGCGEVHGQYTDESLPYCLKCYKKYHE